MQTIEKGSCFFDQFGRGLMREGGTLPPERLSTLKLGLAVRRVRGCDSAFKLAVRNN